MNSDIPDSDTPDIDTPPAGGGTPASAKRRTGYAFRKARAPLPREEAQRQGDISQLAFLRMGGRDPAIAFLNSEDPELGGRPLALATASVEGYVRVAEAIRARAANDA